MHKTIILSVSLLLAQAAYAVEFLDERRPIAAKVQLGKMLFHDKVLSGNQNISCATCHHALTDTGDGLSLPVGEGGRGLGVTRDTGTGGDAIHERVPRNAPPVFMLGATGVSRLFHDGRVEADAEFPSGFRSPAGHHLPDGLDNILAVQAMFPVTSGTEMAGQPGENPLADAAALGAQNVWPLLTARLQAIPAYEPLFKAAFPDISAANDITYVHAANAIAAFEIDAWRADNSPWDTYRGGDPKALTWMQKKGEQLFFGKAGCAACHNGPLFSDMEFHAIAMPQVGPGKGDGPDGRDDFGRFRETQVPHDMFAFRTPPLRNVALTAPYGHSGAYDSLEAAVRHHLDPVAAVWAYHDDRRCHTEPVMPSRDDLDALDCVVMDDPARVQAIADAAAQYVPVQLTDPEVEQLLSFLHALTDPGSIDLRNDVPASVPSGLTLAE